MKFALVFMVCLLGLSADTAPDARIPYFSNVRPVQIESADRQNFAVVDEAVWRYARPDLGDLRLYANGREVPYALTVQHRSQETKQYEAKILNVGRTEGATQFDLDLSGIPAYNEITLGLAQSARDFVARARVVGLDDLQRHKTVDLGTSTLFDFSREKLGSNSTLRLLKPATFRFVRVTLPEILPEQILRATVADTRERASNWTPVAVSPRIEQQGRTTVITWGAPDTVPIARLLFSVDPSLQNFRRTIEIQKDNGDVVATNEISRIHLVRDGKLVNAEALSIEFPDARAAKFRAVIQNGDDAPLPLAQVRVFALERRIYFDPAGYSSLSLYFGDSQLMAPVYDYAKFFRAEESAALATLGPAIHNAVYTGRPDRRPWTERHPALLWTALVLAVSGLGAMALRGMKNS